MAERRTETALEVRVKAGGRRNRGARPPLQCQERPRRTTRPAQVPGGQAAARCARRPKGRPSTPGTTGRMGATKGPAARGRHRSRRRSRGRRRIGQRLGNRRPSPGTRQSRRTRGARIGSTAANRPSLRGRRRSSAPTGAGTRTRRTPSGTWRVLQDNRNLRRGSQRRRNGRRRTERRSEGVPGKDRGLSRGGKRRYSSTPHRSMRRHEGMSVRSKGVKRLMQRETKKGLEKRKKTSRRNTTVQIRQVQQGRSSALQRSDKTIGRKAKPRQDAISGQTAKGGRRRDREGSRERRGRSPRRGGEKGSPLRLSLRTR